MNDKDFKIVLDNHTYILCKYLAGKGKIPAFSIQLIYKDVYEVARYDSKHGTPHKHEDYKRPKKTVWFHGQPNEIVLSLGLADLKGNYENYVDQYKRNYLR